jgi:hypothetical protein
MNDTDMYFGKCVTTIKERFDLSEAGEGRTRLKRTTEFSVSGWCALPKSALIWIGLKNVHRYVFANGPVEPTPNNGMHTTANDAALIRTTPCLMRCVRGG